MNSRPAALTGRHLQPLRTTTDQSARGTMPVAASGEDPLEVARYVESLRRSRMLMATIVLLITGAVIAISLLLPKNFESSADIVINSAFEGGTGTSGEAAQRELATIATLATTKPVLREAALALPRQTTASLEQDVSSSVDQNANIIHITASADSGPTAAAIAYAVAQAFLHQRAIAQRTAAKSALAALDSEIESLRSSGSTSPTAAAQLNALQARAGALETARASSSAQLGLEERPNIPSSPTSPRPFRNAVIALFASLFLAVLVALGREQLTPRVSNQRELGQLLDLPVLAGVPYAKRRVSARHARAEHETYQTLSAALQLALPPSDTPHVLLVTSAAHSEGKSTVTAQLGRMLASAGQRTLIVSGDLRAPRLDDTFGLADRPGLRELLADATTDTVAPKRITDVIVPINPRAAGDEGGDHGALEILPAGGFDRGVSPPLRAGALESVIATLRDGPYAYVLVDSPPMLGIADTQLLARFCDEMLIVGRLDRLEISKVIDLREALFRLSVKPIGLVVIGTRLSDSPYYGDSPYALASS